MKKLCFILALTLSLHSSSQSVFGCWYGYANVKMGGSANNYMVELILQQDKDAVKGVLNYYFKYTYQSFLINGTYDASTRRLVLYDVPMTYHASPLNFEVDCIMNLQATLRVAQAGSSLQGIFFSAPDYKNICPDINLKLTLDAEVSNKDSVKKAISEYKETYQVWKPSVIDTAVAVNIIPRKVINYVIEKEYTERKNEVQNDVEVESDSLKVDFYDNGEIDGDTISVFFNSKLIAYHQRLSLKSVHFDIVLDSLQKINEVTMFAENLGSIPPNTALMVINDGKNRYDIRLSSSLEKNATIKIRRKKDGVKAPK